MQLNMDALIAGLADQPELQAQMKQMIANNSAAMGAAPPVPVPNQTAGSVAAPVTGPVMGPTTPPVPVPVPNYTSAPIAPMAAVPQSMAPAPVVPGQPPQTAVIPPMESSPVPMENSQLPTDPTDWSGATAATPAAAGTPDWAKIAGQVSKFAQSMQGQERPRMLAGKINTESGKELYAQMMAALQSPAAESQQPAWQEQMKALFNKISAERGSMGLKQVLSQTFGSTPNTREGGSDD